ncbi:MAG: Mov34/MPN/PAD-1 family protein [Methylobacterium sp.]|nr:Mov34/MPN/PAD-1 family protein [Methylobacterium sp.]MCA3775830.1 Mov34/MPN/PAD-1 family protein [Cutibacterium sp.]
MSKPLPIPIARALRTIGSHPTIQEISAPRWLNAGDRVVIDIKVEVALPNAWRAAGQSPSGVKLLETLTVSFPVAYPYLAPSITLRADFDRSHPHLQPRPPDLPPEPCLIAGSLRELIHARGILGLMRQLDDWLEKAAMLALNNPTHGWEPVRRDHIDDIITLDATSLRAIETRDGGWTVFRTFYFQTGERPADVYRIEINQKERIGVGPKVLTTLLHRQLAKSEWVGNGLAFVAWPGKQPNGEPFISGKYAPEDVFSTQSLLTRAELYGCRAQLDAFFSLLARRLNSATLKRPIPITLIFIVRRPFKLAGANSSLELCSYVLEVTAGSDLATSAQVPVRLAAHREKISQTVLKRASGIPIEEVCRPWTLIGCGSLGSKLAMHTARSGFAPAVVIDNDIFEPHNFARHAGLPLSSDLDGLLLRPKSSALADDLALLGQRPKSLNNDVIRVVETSSGRACISHEPHGVIVNATASSVVREALAAAPWDQGKRPTIIETSLFGTGKVAYFAREGADQNPSCADLVTEFYRLAQGDPALGRKVFQAEAEVVAIGQGCSAVTFTMPDDTLSLQAASLAIQVRRSLQQSFANNHGLLSVGVVGEDALGLDWRHVLIEPFVVLSSNRSGVPEIRISHRVNLMIAEFVEQAPGVETGGVIVGRFSQATNTFHVVELMTAPPDSVFCAEKFVLGTKGLKARIDQIVKGSGGCLYPLGTWHNHLMPSGPSALDLQTAARLAIHQLFPLLMLIHTSQGFRFLTAEAVAGSPCK